MADLRLSLTVSSSTLSLDDMLDFCYGGKVMLNSPSVTGVLKVFMTECQFMEPAYDVGPHRKTHELVADLIP